MKLKDAYRMGKEILSQAGVAEADLDAWYLIEYVTGLSRASYYADPDREMSLLEEEKYKDAVKRRAKRIPLQHITGEQEFMGLTFQVNEDVLIPRQDTEVLVEEALELLKGGQVPKGEGKTHILDMCTGSGCILLSTLHYAGKETDGTGADISERALAVARENADLLGILAKFVCGDLFENVTGKFGMILSNPPYIRTAEIERLQDEVRFHDPVNALDGMEDGLDFYRRITDEAGSYLEEGGHLIFEIGWDQAEDVVRLMEKTGFTGIRVKKDLAGLDRVVSGVYSGRELSG